VPASPGQAGRNIDIELGGCMEPGIENQIRRQLRKRGDIAFRNMILVGIPGLLLGGAGAVLLIAAPFVLIGSRRLSKRGIFCLVSAVPDYMSQTVQMYKTISGGSKLPEFLVKVMRILGYLIPGNLVQYHFELDGKTYEVGKYMFTWERPYTDQEGQAWALVDRSSPRRKHWLCSIDR
jgi:hypothetical protein